MKPIHQALLSALVLLGFGLAGQAEAAPALKRPAACHGHTVKPGETLMGLAGKNWRQVCQANHLRDCNTIRAGQCLTLSGKAPAKAQGGFVLPVRHRIITPSIPVPYGYSAWVSVGGAPIKGCGDPKRTQEEAFNILGLTVEEKEELNQKKEAGDFTQGNLGVGTRFQVVTFCKNGHAAAKQKMVAAWANGKAVTSKVYTLSTGRKVQWVEECGNWVIVEELPAPPPATPPAPPPEPPAAEEPPPEALPATPEEAKGNCWDPKLVVGQEYEPSRDGNSASASFLSGALYKCWRGTLLGKPGTHGVGIGVQASMWDGRVNHGAGKFDGSFVGVAPAYEFIWDEGRDIEVKAPMIGRLEESFQQGDYQSERAFTTIGAGVTYNDYRREMRGEKTFPKTQVFGMVGVPISGRAEHSWQGQPIQDTSGIDKLDVYAQVGVRQYLYAGKVIRPYVQGGLFAELPGSASASLRLGVADRHEVCGVGVGIDFDLLTGGTAPGLGWWCDVVKGVRVARAHHRAGQITRETGRPVTVEHGIVMVPLPPEKATGS